MTKLARHLLPLLALFCGLNCAHKYGADRQGAPSAQNDAAEKSFAPDYVTLDGAQLAALAAVLRFREQPAHAALSPEERDLGNFDISIGPFYLSRNSDRRDTASYAVSFTTKEIPAAGVVLRPYVYAVRKDSHEVWEHYKQE